MSVVNKIPSPKWTHDILKQTWYSMFKEQHYRMHNDDLDVQGIFLLLEVAYDKVQRE